MALRRLAAQGLRQLARCRIVIPPQGAATAGEASPTIRTISYQLLHEGVGAVGSLFSCPGRFISYDSHVEDKDYHREADRTLELLQDQLDEYLEDNGIEGEVEYSQGVLTVNLGERGTYIINKQSPNHQIWLSSPVSGPLRYDFREQQWVYLRDNHDLVSRLSDELSLLTGVPCSLSMNEG